MLERQWAAQELDHAARRRATRSCPRAIPRASPDGDPRIRRGVAPREAGDGQPGRFADTTRRLITRPARPGVAVALGALAGLMMVLLGLGID